MGLRIYTVHTPPWSPTPDADAILVKEGFGWPAFLFGPLWALWHGMWRTALALSAVYAAAPALAALAGLGAGARFALMAGLLLALGLWANDWRRHVLFRRDYAECAVVAGRRLGDAERRFLPGAG